MLFRVNKAFIFVAISAVIGAQSGIAQTPLAQNPPAPASASQNLPKLTLQEAEAMAIQNHPQIQAAQHEINYSNQQIVVNRAAYYPDVTGDLTGSQGNNLARIGAGDLTASRLFDRFGQGAVVRQLITDSGRTSNLVASSRLQAQAVAQNAQATRYDVLLQVNRAYFDVLRAQQIVKVAEETVGARQLLSDQVTELAKNGLKSQLDASFAEVNVSQAKLLLVRAQDAVQQAQAELGRAIGSDQPANYQLTDEPLPAGPPTTAPRIRGHVPEGQPSRACRSSFFTRCRLQIRGR